MGYLRVATLNVRGMKMLQQRTAVIISLKMLVFEVLFLQEYHLQGYNDVQLFLLDGGGGLLFVGVGNVRVEFCSTLGSL